ncbi:hypothetical protein GF389_04395 [Candidatus Dojkabacteria bacterium]|nr:hypothetical protein [Candidatus Dojkabacteria bacterium]
MLNFSNNKNIIISSWPSAGGTTAARFISLVLNMKYVYAGGVLKHWADSMGYDSKTQRIMEWERKYHKHWDYVWENFIAKYALNSKNTLLEGMTAGFMIQSDKVYKIFIKASLKARMKRAANDKRTETVQERDYFLRDEWNARFGINIFDEQQISDNYDYILDTSYIGIKEVWTKILKNLAKNRARKFSLKKKLNEADEIYDKVQSNPDYLKNELGERDLFFRSEKVLEIIKEQYPELIRDIPEDMRSVM